MNLSEMVSSGKAMRGLDGHGMARQVRLRVVRLVRSGKVCKVGFGSAWRGRYGEFRRGSEWQAGQGKVRSVEAGIGKTGQCAAGLGRHGKAGQGYVGLYWARRGMAGLERRGLDVQGGTVRVMFRLGAAGVETSRKKKEGLTK